jgi:acylphosphatase
MNFWRYWRDEQVKTRAYIIVTGLVQGVNFRYHTRQTALGLNVTGWVRNLPDGRVQGCFEGEEADVAALIAWCRKGPDWARVDDADVSMEEYRGEFVDFEVRR